MSETAFFTTQQGRKLAYHRSEGRGPWVVFLGGLRSDMTGTKAVFLEDWAQRAGRAFLRFDYSGHGESDGEFVKGCIGDWAEDAAAIIDALTDGQVVLVGSSMGGWISLLMARAMPARLAGLVTIAAAPDFTEDSFWGEWSDQQRTICMNEGQLALPSDYGDPMIVTRRMIEDGRAHLVLHSPLSVNAPMRMLQGTDDEDVPVSVGMRLLDHVSGADVRLELVKGADHRFSDAACLATISRALEEVLDNA